MKYIDEIYIYCDGGCKPNPGTMVGAYIILDNEGNVLKGPIGFNLGEGTNITAEIKSIEKSLEDGISCTRKKVVVHSDNEFAVKAINKEKRITKADHLKPVLIQIYQKAAVFEEVSYTHVPESNKYIDQCHKTCEITFRQLGF